MEELELAQSCLKKNDAQPPRFKCELCNFEDNKKSNYDRHLTTPKHKKNTGTFVNDKEIIEMLRKQLQEKDNELNSLKQENDRLKYEIDCNAEMAKQQIQNANEKIALLQDMNNILKDTNDKLIESNSKVVYCEKNEKPSTNDNSNKKQPFNKDQYFNETCKNAHTIEDDFENNVNTMTLETFKDTFGNRKYYVEGFILFWKKCVSKLQRNKPIQTTDGHSGREHIYFKTKYVLHDNQLTVGETAKWHNVAFEGKKISVNNEQEEYNCHLFNKIMTTLFTNINKRYNEVRERGYEAETKTSNMNLKTTLVDFPSPVSDNWRKFIVAISEETKVQTD